MSRMATINPIEVQKYLKGMSYPITRKGLGTTTKSEKAPSEVVDALENIDEDDYANVTDVTKALGKLND